VLSGSSGRRRNALIQNLHEGRSDPEPTFNQPMVNASEISVMFGGIHALKHVSIAIPAGQRCWIIGPNGRKLNKYNLLYKKN